MLRVHSPGAFFIFVSHIIVFMTFDGFRCIAIPYCFV
ncbi:MAG: hypothetical protein RLZZ444_1898 [Pseudomonadota bacterium]|jgi:hypothetical protein